MSSRIREIAKAQGLTQTELSHRCRLDPSYLSKIVRGHITPTVTTARKIAAELGVSIDEAFPADEEAA